MRASPKWSEFKWAAVRAALERHGDEYAWNYKHASAALGLDPSNFRRILREHGLTRPDNVPKYVYRGGNRKREELET